MLGLAEGEGEGEREYKRKCRRCGSDRHDACMEFELKDSHLSNWFALIYDGRKFQEENK